METNKSNTQQNASSPPSGNRSNFNEERFLNNVQDLEKDINNLPNIDSLDKEFAAMFPQKGGNNKKNNRTAKNQNKDQYSPQSSNSPNDRGNRNNQASFNDSNNDNIASPNNVPLDFADNNNSSPQEDFQLADDFTNNDPFASLGENTNPFADDFTNSQDPFAVNSAPSNDFSMADDFTNSQDPFAVNSAPSNDFSMADDSPNSQDPFAVNSAPSNDFSMADDFTNSQDPFAVNSAPSNDFSMADDSPNSQDPFAVNSAPSNDFSMADDSPNSQDPFATNSAPSNDFSMADDSPNSQDPFAVNSAPSNDFSMADDSPNSQDPFAVNSAPSNDFSMADDFTNSQDPFAVNSAPSNDFSMADDSPNSQDPFAVNSAPSNDFSMADDSPNSQDPFAVNSAPSNDFSMADDSPNSQDPFAVNSAPSNDFSMADDFTNSQDPFAVNSAPSNDFSMADDSPNSQDPFAVNSAPSNDFSMADDSPNSQDPFATNSAPSNDFSMADDSPNSQDPFATNSAPSNDFSMADDSPNSQDPFAVNSAPSNDFSMADDSPNSQDPFAVNSAPSNDFSMADDFTNSQDPFANLDSPQNTPGNFEPTQNSDSSFLDDDDFDVNNGVDQANRNFINMDSDAKETPFSTSNSNVDSFFDSDDDFEETSHIIPKKQGLNDAKLFEDLAQKVDATKPNKYFDKNIDALEQNFADYIHHLFINEDTSRSVKEALTKELNKKSPNIYKLEEIADYDSPEDVSSQEKPKREKISKPKSTLPLKQILIGALTVMILSIGVYFSFFSPTALGESQLKKGLRLIKQSEFKQANMIFDNNSPNVGWYNKYALAFMNQGALNLAEEKLLGVKNGKKGAIDIDPRRKETLLNIAELFIREGQFDKAFNDDPKKGVVTLDYLSARYPQDEGIRNYIGTAYMKWGQSLKNPIDQKQKFEKANDIFYGLFKENPKNTDTISKLLEISLLTNENLRERLGYISAYKLEKKLSDEALSDLLMNYLNKGKNSDATMIFNILRSRVPHITNPSIFYTLGQYYMKSGDLFSAESNFIKGTYENSNYDNDGQITSTKNALLQAKFDNSLGQVYLHIIPEYSSGSKSDTQNRNKFTKLARYHFDQAQKLNPGDPDSLYLSGNFYYSIDKNYPKATQSLQTAYNMYKKDNKPIPLDLSYNLGNSLYKQKEYQKALNVLSDARAGTPLTNPSLEYLLGMVYLNMGVNSEAIAKLSNALDYYSDSLDAIKAKSVPSSLHDNQVLYFSSIIDNNLGTIYQKQGDSNGNPDDKNKARTYFYNALENGNRINPSYTLTNPSLNLQHNLLQDNLQFVQNFGVPGRNTLTYDFSPQFADQYL